jgi:predicted anti-sigma-YlaC factor YlaD
VTCDEFKKLIGDYLDDEVADELCKEIQEHLGDCRSCSVEVDTLEKTIRIYRGAHAPLTLSMDARQRLFRALTFEYHNAKRAPSS